MTAPTNSKVFLCGLWLTRIEDLIKGYKLGVASHFPASFGTKRHTLFYTLTPFRIIGALLPQRMYGYPQFPFWISESLAKICVFYLDINRYSDTLFCFCLFPMDRKSKKQAIIVRNVLVYCLSLSVYIVI